MLESYSKSGIINAADLNDIRDHQNVKILDATFVLPNAGVDPVAEFEKAHIPGAQFFNIKDFADPASSLPHMICSAEEFASRISKLGIQNDDFVVVYGQSGMIMGPPRAWWSFRLFGHDNVAVLNGGLPAWVAAGFETEAGVAEIYAPSHYKAALQSDLVRDIGDVKAAMDNSSTILDARPAERFAGTTPEPRENMRSGHIPGSKNIPCSTLVDENGLFKSQDALKEIFENSGFDLGSHKTLTCGSGVTACAIALALHHIGVDEWSVYDGSWSEWGLEESGTPVSTL